MCYKNLFELTPTQKAFLSCFSGSVISCLSFSEMLFICSAKQRALTAPERINLILFTGFQRSAVTLNICSSPLCFFAFCIPASLPAGGYFLFTVSAFFMLLVFIISTSLMYVFLSSPLTLC